MAEEIERAPSYVLIARGGAERAARGIGELL
jgi:hypothetical protein